MKNTIWLIGLFLGFCVAVAVAEENQSATAAGTESNPYPYTFFDPSKASVAASGRLTSVPPVIPFYYYTALIPWGVGPVSIWPGNYGVNGIPCYFPFFYYPLSFYCSSTQFNIRVRF